MTSPSNLIDPAMASTTRSAGAAMKLRWGEQPVEADGHSESRHQVENYREQPFLGCRKHKHGNGQAGNARGSASRLS
jgi:hypothetical protein